MMGLLTVTVREVPIKTTATSSMPRWFVDVACRGYHEVWSESNYDNEGSATKRAMDIRHNPHHFLSHFVRAEHLSMNNHPGDPVFWVTVDNNIRKGRLVEYDTNGNGVGQCVIAEGGAS